MDTYAQSKIRMSVYGSLVKKVAMKIKIVRICRTSITALVTNIHANRANEKEWDVWLCSCRLHLYGATLPLTYPDHPNKLASTT